MVTIFIMCACVLDPTSSSTAESVGSYLEACKLLVPRAPHIVPHACKVATDETWKNIARTTPHA